MPFIEDMVECCACGSGTYEPMVIHSEDGKCETYCSRCFKVFAQPVDNNGDTPK